MSDDNRPLYERHPMISHQVTETIGDLTTVLGRIEAEATLESTHLSAPVLADIRAMRRDLDRLEREVLDIAEDDSDGGDAC